MPTARTATRVTTGYAAQEMPFAGFQAEIWRVPAGTADDTATITPAAGRIVASVLGGAFTHNLSSAGGATVQLTYLVTTTASQDVIVLIQP